MDVKVGRNEWQYKITYVDSEGDQDRAYQDQNQRGYYLNSPHNSVGVMAGTLLSAKSRTFRVTM